MYVINPENGKRIKVGGPTFNRLKKAGYSLGGEECSYRRSLFELRRVAPDHKNKNRKKDDERE